MTTNSTSLIKLGGQTRHTANGRRGLIIALVLAAVSLLAGLLLPLLLSQAYIITVLVDATIVSIVAVSIGFLYRHLGLISLGQSAFFGGAAYTTAILNVKLGWGLMPAAIGGFLAGILLALIVGLLVMRARGITFLMLTMALGLSLFYIVLMEPARPLTGGYDGLILIPSPEDSFFGMTTRDLLNDRSFWPVVWGVLVIVALVLWLIGRSRFGTVLHGIRENEERMRFSGFNTLAPRLAAFVIAGAVASVAGVLMVLNSGLVTDQALGFHAGSQQLVATIVGGMSTVAGPVVGAFIFTGLQSAFSSAGGMELFLGLTLVIVLAFLRGGIVGGIEDAVRWVRKRRGSRGTQDQSDRGGER